LVRRVEEMAAAAGCTPAQLALAWVLAQGEDVVPIFGTKKRVYLQENLGALEIILTPADLAHLEAVAPRGAAAGPRYPAAMMKLLSL
jgi:aryl-alcohol dehydrogenase-like predicted oxidoreductase